MCVINRATLETFCLKEDFFNALRNKDAFVNFIAKAVNTVRFLLNFILLRMKK